ncbi:hypothetical protein PTKIN_Ptkin01aG0343700 [Pterospermum kingtungense]
MASGNEYFSRAGPSHLISVDWNNAHHRRSVAASLVMGAYMIEDDRLKRRQGSKKYLHQSSRVEIAMSVVQDVVTAVGDSKVWLAGHSLGAAMAMVAGKTMAKAGRILEAFLLNPPFLSLPIERIRYKKVRHGLRFAGTLIKAGLALAARDSNNHEDPFAAMSGWIPCLFMNQVDIVCSEYIGYFRHRKKLEAMGARALARISSHRSLGNTITSAVGIRGVETSEPLHLLPSAKLTENLCPPQYITEAHGLSQWWRPNLNLKCTVYKYT